MFRPVYLIGAVLTALWLFIVWFYVASEVGWENLFYMMPFEVFLFFAAVAVPIAFLWLIISFMELAERHRLNRETVFDLAQRMADAAPAARHEAKALSDEIDRQITNLDKLTKTAEATCKTVAKLGGEADSAVRTATERTAADAETIRNTFQGFVADVSKTAEESAGKLQTAIETSVDATFTEDLKATVDRLEKESGSITTASQDLAKRIEGVEALFESHRDKLGKAAENATAQADQIRQTFDKQGKELSGMSDAMFEKIGRIHEALENQISLLRRSAEEVVVQIDELDKKSVDAGGKVETIGAGLRKLVDETIDNEMARVGAATAESGKQVKAAADAVVNTLDSALRDQLTKMEWAAAKLNEDIAGLNATMSESTEQLESVVKTTAEEATETVSLFHKQVQELSEATRAAADQTDAVREAVSEGRRDSFLRASTSVIRELNELAVEIDRVFEPQLPDNIMKLYEDGDHGIFVRRIARSRDEHSVPMIRERMRKNSGFRHNVETFMKRYESLLAQTNDVDPDRILTATLLTADVGKVYMLLARANQKEH